MKAKIIRKKCNDLAAVTRIEPAAVQVECKPAYLRRPAAARYLGVSVRTLGSLQARHVIPFSKLGARTVLFKLADLEAAVCRYRQDAVWESAGEA